MGKKGSGLMDQFSTSILGVVSAWRSHASAYPSPVAMVCGFQRATGAPVCVGISIEMLAVARSAARVARRGAWWCSWRQLSCVQLTAMQRGKHMQVQTFTRHCATCDFAAAALAKQTSKRHRPCKSSMTNITTRQTWRADLSLAKAAAEEQPRMACTQTKVTDFASRIVWFVFLAA